MEKEEETESEIKTIRHAVERRPVASSHDKGIGLEGIRQLITIRRSRAKVPANHRIRQ